MPDSKAPVEATQPPVVAVFAGVIRELADVMDTVRHQDAVDVELHFQSATVDQHGIPLFTKHLTESQLQIRLATRLTPRLPRTK